jgi:serine/threonine protein kinase/tetratricopeptide (TPR) repeat protein
MTRAVRSPARESPPGDGRISVRAFGSRPSWDAAPRSSRLSERSRSWTGGPFDLDESAIIDEFTECWDRGESPRIEDFLSRIPPESPGLAVELIYRRFCLEEADGSAPDSAAYLDRFAEYREPLSRLFRLHDAVSGSQVEHWARLDDSTTRDDPFAFEPELPAAGDQIGPFLLRRELGEGAFARVFLAEQTDLDDRQVVIKVSSRPSREPWLLARARHPHIVEIISQYEVDEGALQLICMPFLGGATLSRLLEALRRRPRRPASGRELLSELDGVAAAEYPEGRRSRTSRDIVAGSTLEQALAWMVARLAEALDHASTLRVAHGDVKPSNVLIAADATPMLLDFNLAQDWGAVDAGLGPIDRGGTFAYMAPERLRGFAGPRGPSTPFDPHVADIYSLGMIFLEMLSNRIPTLPKEFGPASNGRREAAAKFRREAARLAEQRSRTSPRAMVRTSAGDRIGPTLRAILARCLDPDPARRYRRGRELAVDLDRWRTDRPLVYAREAPFPAACRRIRRWRRPLLAVAAVVLAAASVGFGVSRLVNSRNLETWKKMGLEMYANLVDAPESPIFSFLRMMIAGDRQELSYLPAAGAGEDPRALGPEVESKAMEVATLALRDYRLLESKDWREREDVRALPRADRDELELWLMEQAYRYCHELASRPESPDDWERALTALDRLSATVPLAAFSQLRDRLGRALDEIKVRQGLPGAPVHRTNPAAVSTIEPNRIPAWLDDYVLGVALECEAAGPNATADGAAERQTGSIDERALSHYRAALGHRPDSFWAHYRAAVVCRRLGLILDTSAHLHSCARRRPENPAVRGQLAGSLLLQNRLGEALAECDRAIALDPDHAEYYRTRAFIDANLGRSEEIRDDLYRFEVLSRTIPPEQLRTQFRPGRPRGESSPEDLRLSISPGRSDSTPHPVARRYGRRRAADPDDLNTRLNLANAIYEKTRDADQTIAELTKVLAIDPGYLHARLYRAKLFVMAGAFEEANRDLDRIMDRPVVHDFLRDNRDVVGRIIDISWEFMRRGRNEDGLAHARRALEFAEEVESHIGLAHYAVARANARLAASDPAHIAQAVEHLVKAIERQWEREGFAEWYRQDISFHHIRNRVDEALEVEVKRTPRRPDVQAAFLRAVKHTD